ncbi:MAG: hypothetical protein ABI131_10895 [Nostocoides sp.]
MSAWVALLVAAGILAAGSIYLWMRVPGDAEDTKPWPHPRPGHTPVGAGREFDTLALAESLVRARKDPARAGVTAVVIHRRLAAVVDARLAARAADEHPVPVATLAAVLQFRDNPPNAAALTDPALLAELLQQIEAL